MKIMRDKISNFEDPNIVPQETGPVGGSRPQESRTVHSDKISLSDAPLAGLEQQQIDAILHTVSGGPENVQDIYYLSSLQEGILFHHLLDPEYDTYVLSTLFEVASRARLSVLIAAIQKVIERHDVLRTSVVWEGLRRPVQIVHRQVTLPVEELSFDPDGDLREHLKELTRPCGNSLNLGRAPLARVRIAEHATSSTWYAFLQVHHIICDHQSLRILVGEVMDCLAGREAELSGAAAYRDYIVDMQIDAVQRKSAEEFFRGKLGTIEEGTAPFGLMGVHGRGNRISEAMERLEDELAQRTRAVAKHWHVSSARLFHAAWALVVARTSGRADVVFGTVLLARRQRTLPNERVMGMSVNTLPVRLSLQGIAVSELVKQTDESLSELLTWERAPLSLALGCSGIGKDEPLFTSLLNCRRSHSDGKAQVDEVAGVRVLARGEAFANYPIALAVDDLGEGFELLAHTDERINPHRVIGYFRTALSSLVQALEQAPDTPALELSILPESERREIIGVFSGNQSIDAPLGTIPEVFERQAARTPAAEAIVFGAKRLTYAELDVASNQLAHRLREQGVGPDALVAVCLERGVESVVGLIGVLKAGGAYVPLDPTHPSDRLTYMLEDASPRVLLTHEKFRKKFSGLATTIISFDENWAEIAKGDHRPPSSVGVGLRPQNLAYVIYTSGSTGRPKGVMVDHHSVLNLWQGLERIYESVSACTRVALNASFSFDASVQQLVHLLSGRTLFLLSEEFRRDPSLLLKYLREHGIEGVDCTPSQLKSWVSEGLLISSGPALDFVLVGGEAIDRGLWTSLARSSRTSFFNVYGPTECTVDATIAPIRGDMAETPHIGTPMENRRIYVLDSSAEPVPIGVVGEIFIGGAGVGRGYLHRATMTAERFIPDPFSDIPQARMYKTGDLGRWRDNGTLEYLGRNDNQVKIRGFRIETGEIEAQLRHCPGVKEAVVVAREDVPGEKRLVAYVVPGESSPMEASLKESLSSLLRTILPEHMMPSAFVMLERMPLTPSGKLDRRALPAPGVSFNAIQRYEAPRPGIEETLARVWQRQLHLERVGRHENYFELGGHSLMIVKMIENLRRIGYAADVRQVFDNPRLSDLAAVLTPIESNKPEIPSAAIPLCCEAITPQMIPFIELTSEQIEAIVKETQGGAGNVQDIYPLAPMQEGILSHRLMNPEGSDVYVRTLLFSLSSRQKTEDFVAALRWAVDRHDVMRTAIQWENLPQAVQVVHRRATLPVEWNVLGPGGCSLRELREHLISKPPGIDLTQTPLLRLQIEADRHGGRWFAALRTHHVLFDDQSLDILISELRAHMRGESGRLPETVPYRNYVGWVLASAHKQDAEDFFRRKLGDVEAPTIPFEIIDVHCDSTCIERTLETLERDLSTRIRRQARRVGVTTAALLHAAWGLVVSRTSGRDDVVFGTVLTGRFQGAANTQRSVGIAINTLPLRLLLRDWTVKELVERTQRELVDLLAYEQTPLAIARRCSGIRGAMPLFSSLLNYLHVSQSSAENVPDADSLSLLEVQGATNFPVVLTVKEFEESFVLELETDRRIDAQRLIGYVRKTLISLTDALENSPKTKALLLPVLPEREHEQVISRFNDGVAILPQGKLIHRTFEEQAERTPDAVAAVYEEKSLTYAELNARANQLACHLRVLCIGPDKLVGVCIERGLEMLVALLGVLKAGGAYVPLDPTYPTDRIAYMLGDASPKVLLTTSSSVESLPQASAEIILLDGDWDAISERSKANLSPGSTGVRPDNLAYVIYTSGSTGRPKGVMVDHRNVTRLFAATQRWFEFNERDVWALFHSFSFDFSVWEIWGALLFGGRVEVVPYLSSRSPHEFYRLMCQREVTVLNQTPSAFAQLIDAQANAQQVACGQNALRFVIFGGEALNVQALRPWVERNGLESPRLVNMYGITEATVHVTYHPLTKHDIFTGRGSPIGKPIPDLRVYILDKYGQAAPIDVVGEFYIGGAGVARGYLNRSDLTAERIVPDPFSSDSSARLYKTGDLGLWRSDGTIEYLGRNDTQVKIRGFRIELGEIEARLRAYPEVKDALVVTREFSAGDRRIVAYVASRERACDCLTEASPSTASIVINNDDALLMEKLRIQLKRELPDYMVPSAFVLVSRFPLSANGKLDTKALPVPTDFAHQRRTSEDPQGRIEEALADIWKDVLRAKRIGRDDDFFELGGDSILGIRVMTRVALKLGAQPVLATVFKYPTIREMAVMVEDLLRSAALASPSSDRGYAEEGVI
jgi:amino acid adenylation domain-containing protein